MAKKASKKVAKKTSKSAANEKAKEKDLRKARGCLILIISLQLLGPNRSRKNIKAKKKARKAGKR